MWRKFSIIIIIFYIILFLSLEVIVMAYVAPTVRSVGDAVTAADYNIMANSVIQVAGLSQGVFTNEAARDAAITSPTKGMIAYITAPTIPAATGTLTAAPTGGVKTIYNGSVWVCVTPVGAATAASGTTIATAYAAALSGSPGTNPSVTLVTGTTALITHSFVGSQTGVGHLAYQSVAISGAGVVAASVDWEGAMYNGAAGLQSYVTIPQVITGLTAGTNTFTLQYKSSASGQTATIYNRRLIVQGVA